MLNPEILDALENLTNIPYVVELPDYNFDEIVRLLKREKSEELRVRSSMILQRIL